MDEKLISKNTGEKSETSYFTELKDSNLKQSFSQESSRNPIESSSSNKLRPIFVFEKSNNNDENLKRKLQNKLNGVIPNFLPESSSFENDKENLIDFFSSLKDESFFISIHPNILSNYSWISKDVIRRLIGTKFHIKYEEEEVLEFLINHQDHCSKILEFRKVIVNYVKAPRLELEYLKDPEEGCSTLNIIVQTDLSPQDALEIEDKIFYEYFEDIFMDNAFKLNFRIVSNVL